MCGPRLELLAEDCTGRLRMAVSSLTVDETDDAGDGRARQQPGHRNINAVQNARNDQMLAPQRFRVGDVGCSFGGHPGILALFGDTCPHPEFRLSHSRTEHRYGDARVPEL